MTALNLEKMEHIFLVSGIVFESHSLAISSGTQALLGALVMSPALLRALLQLEKTERALLRIDRDTQKQNFVFSSFVGRLTSQGPNELSSTFLLVLF